MTAGSVAGMAAAGKVTVAVKVSIELDAAAWAKLNGLGDGGDAFKVADVRADVRSFVLNLIQQCSSIEDADATVTLA